MLLLLLAACASQERPVTRDDPWQDYDPTERRRTYDEDYVPPSRMNADQLVERAKRAEREGRDDQARVEYHAAFRKDRWHSTANVGYQDLMVRNDLWDVLWQEYLDLWFENQKRGDALWFHLRPMLIERRNAAMPVEHRASIDAGQIDRINELTALVTEYAEAGERDAAIEAIDRAIAIADLPVLHRIRIELLHPVDYDALLSEYAERAEENPASGDNLYLHAKVVAVRDVPAAVAMLRDGWVIGVPGWWLRFGLGEFCIQLAEAELPAALEGDVVARRSVLGYFGAAESFLLACLDARPNEPTAAGLLGYLWREREQLE